MCVCVLLTRQEVSECIDEVFRVLQVSVYINPHLFNLIGQLVCGQSRLID